MNTNIAERTDGFNLNAGPLVSSSFRELNRSEPKNIEAGSQHEHEADGQAEYTKKDDYSDSNSGRNDKLAGEPPKQ